MKEIDQILEAGLASYVAAEPRNGLEGRVLACVRERRPRRIWWLAWAAAAAAVMVVLVVKPAPEPPKPEPLIALIPAGELKFSLPPVRVTVVPGPVSRPRPVLKEDVFPSPVPLTDEERLLVGWAAKAPELFERPSDAPIQIEEIKIQPLNGSH